MKRFTLLLLVIFLVLSIGSCTYFEKEKNLIESNVDLEIDDSKESDEKEVLPEDNIDDVLFVEPLSREINQITIAIDPRLELLTIIQYLSDYKDNYKVFVTGDGLKYAEGVKEYFKDYLDHPIIEYIGKNTGFGHDLPIKLMLNLNQDFTINSEEVLEEVKSRTSDFSTDEYISLLKDFYLKSDFKEFFKENEEYYNEILDDVFNDFPKNLDVKSLEEFYKENKAGYYIYPVALYSNVGYGGFFLNDQGENIYSIVGTGGIEVGMSKFGSEAGFTGLVYHEFGHSFIYISDRAVSTSTKKALDDTEYLFEPLKAKMTSMSYGTWNNTLEEHVLRAATIKIHKINADKEGKEIDIAWYLANEKYEGFIYIETIFNSLDKYLENFNNYESFDEFIPVIAEDLIPAN